MMTENERQPEPTPTHENVVGLVARFAGPEALVAAAEHVRDAGYRKWDTHSPYPVHGMDRAMGIRPTILPWLVLGAGIAGGLFALWLQWWANGVDYPIVASGKPRFAWPANIPITFELIVLFSALTAFGGVLALNQLPQFWHSAFAAQQFVRVTTDGFFVSIEATDPKFDEAATRALLESAGATAVETCHAPAEEAKMPAGVYWAVAVLAALALLPPAWIAKTRMTPSDKTAIMFITDMVNQPKYQMQQSSPLFADGRAMRPPVPRTVALNELESDPPFYQGKAAGGEFVTDFPVTVNDPLMKRGQERFAIYCATCHGLAGDGDGMTAQRATKRVEPNWVPPSQLYDPRLREMPVGQLFHTITNGVRKMPAYGVQIAPADRWAIVLYVRALQRSHAASIQDVPEDLRDKLR
jgi:mono/diheme cytochrome c family protein